MHYLHWKRHSGSPSQGLGKYKYTHYLKVDSYRAIDTSGRIVCMKKCAHTYILISVYTQNAIDAAMINM